MLSKESANLSCLVKHDLGAEINVVLNTIQLIKEKSYLSSTDIEHQIACIKSVKHDICVGMSVVLNVSQLEYSWREIYLVV